MPAVYDVRPGAIFTENSFRLLQRKITGHLVTKPPPWFYHFVKKQTKI